MKNQKVQITCDGNFFVNLDELKDFQEGLKTLTDENKNSLKENILKFGFSFPFFIWEDDEKNKWINDGHQRQIVLQEMQNEGIELPDKFPACHVFAKDKKEAAEKLLLVSSQYGKFNEEGLYEFSQKYELDLPELKLDLPGINLDFIDTKIIDETDPEKLWQGMPEFEQKDAKSFHSIVVHFKSQDDLDNFANLIEQNINNKTKYIWYPKLVIEHYGDIKTN